MRIRQIVGNIAVLGGSLLVGVVLVELLLRVFYPEYQYAAEAGFDPDEIRIFSNHPDTYAERPHPDTLVRHSVIHNNLGLRQHRDILDTDLQGEVIAVFGDSFVENLRLPVQYGFVDTMDDLLNAAGRPVTVLNFGTDGYSLDQEYLYYLSSPQAQRARHVLYVFCANDVRGLYENRLFHLDESGQLVRSEVPQPSLATRLISRLYLTYFALEARAALLGIGGEGRRYTATDFVDSQLKREWWERFESPPGQALEASFQAGDFSEIMPQLQLFQRLLEAWQDAVERNGGRFEVVLLPEPQEQPVRRLLSPDMPLIDLYEAFRALIPNYDYQQVRFSRDPHWNELGNMYAAIVLARAIEAADGQAVQNDKDIAAGLARYYAAFAQGWRPSALFGSALPPDDDEAAQEAIRLKYLERDLRPAHTS